MFNATDVYGAGPIAGQTGGRGSMKVVAGGRGNPSPAAEAAAPRASSMTGIADDPAFWLVAMLGAAAGLAIWSS